MTLVLWGRSLLLWGLVGAALGSAPLLILIVLPGLEVGLLRLMAFFLALSVAPFCLAIAAFGFLLLLVGLFRR